MLNTHKGEFWAIIDGLTSKPVILPWQPINLEGSEPLPAGSLVTLSCGLLAGEGACAYIGKGVKTGIAPAPVKCGRMHFARLSPPAWHGKPLTNQEHR